MAPSHLQDIVYISCRTQKLNIHLLLDFLKTEVESIFVLAVVVVSTILWNCLPSQKNTQNNESFRGNSLFLGFFSLLYLNYTSTFVFYCVFCNYLRNWLVFTHLYWAFALNYYFIALEWFCFNFSLCKINITFYHAGFGTYWYLLPYTCNPPVKYSSVLI